MRLPLCIRYPEQGAAASLQIINKSKVIVRSGDTSCFTYLGEDKSGYLHKYSIKESIEGGIKAPSNCTIALEKQIILWTMPKIRKR